MHSLTCDLWTKTFAGIILHFFGDFSIINPFSAKDALIDFTLSNARRFYLSMGNPLALKGLKLVNYSKLDVQPAHLMHLLIEDWEWATVTVNQEGLESNLSWHVSLVGQGRTGKKQLKVTSTCIVMDWYWSWQWSESMINWQNKTCHFW